MLFGGTVFNRAYFYKKTLGKEITEYNADEWGSRIVNIPYDDYISTGDIPPNSYICNVSEKNSAVRNTEIIEKQIETAAENNGTVVIPKGIYKIARIHLKDNVKLFVQRGSTLIKGRSFIAQFH